MRQGDKFNLRALSDFVWKNGNVPIGCSAGNYSVSGRSPVEAVAAHSAQAMSTRSNPRDPPHHLLGYAAYYLAMAKLDVLRKEFSAWEVVSRADFSKES